MPDVIAIRVLRHGPAQDHGLESLLVYELIKKSRPRYGLQLDLYAELCHLALHERGYVLAHLVALVRDELKLKVNAIPVQYAVTVGVGPSGFRQEAFCLPRIVRISFHFFAIPPCTLQEGACAGFSEPQQDTVYDLPLVYGAGKGLPYPSVPEKGFFQVIAYVSVGVREIFVGCEVCLEP